MMHKTGYLIIEHSANILDCGVLQYLQVEPELLTYDINVSLWLQVLQVVIIRIVCKKFNYTQGYV